MLAKGQQCTNYAWLCYKETPEVSCSKNKGHPLWHAGEVDGMTTHSTGLQGKEINYQFPLSHLETSNVFWSRALSLLWPRDISKQSPLVLSNDSEDYSRWPQPSPSALDPLSSLVSWISVPLPSFLGNFPSAWTQQIDYLFGQSALLWTITAACTASQITHFGTCGQL